MPKILYIGPNSGTSGHRFQALRRLRHEVRIIDPFLAFGYAPQLMRWGFKTGYLGLERRIASYVLDMVGSERFDVIWVDNGEQIGASLVARLRPHATFVLNHNLDNPFTGRDGFRWRLFRKALPLYDLFVTPRVSTRDAARANGARRAIAVMFSADEEVHRRATMSDADRHRFGSEVAFVGTWMPERGPFMKRLIERGVPLRIFGPRWEKAAEFPVLAPHLMSKFMSDAEYVKAVSGTKIALGLLSRGNQDLHTTRSMEIPAIGTLFCAPRTSDHEALYVDGQEAVFFDDADSCAEACLALLKDARRRDAIARAGCDRAKRNNWFNERLCADILTGLDPDLVSPHTARVPATAERDHEPSLLLRPAAVSDRQADDLLPAVKLCET